MNRDIHEIQMACFSLGESLFCVDIMRIKEIIMPQKLSNLPRASDLLDGVINLRGNVIPVMDVRRLFGMSRISDDKTGKLLVVSLARQTLALAVDNVTEVINVPVTEIKPPLDASEGIGMEHILGVCIADDRVCMILDIDSLLGQTELRECA